MYVSSVPKEPHSPPPFQLNINSFCNVHSCSCSQQQAGQSWHSFTLSAVIILDLANKPGECSQPWALSVPCPAELKCHCGLRASQLTHAACVTGDKVLIAWVEEA